jgi:hypothetical protein
MPRPRRRGCRAIARSETELQCVYVVLIFVPCRSCRISCVTVVLRHSGFATPCIFRAAVVRLCQGLTRRTSGCAVFRAAFASAALRVPHLRRHCRHGSRPAAGTLATLARAATASSSPTYRRNRGPRLRGGDSGPGRERRHCRGQRRARDRKTRALAPHRRGWRPC